MDIEQIKKAIFNSGIFKLAKNQEEFNGFINNLSVLDQHHDQAVDLVIEAIKLFREEHSVPKEWLLMPSKFDLSTYGVVG